MSSSRNNPVPATLVAQAEAALAALIARSGARRLLVALSGGLDSSVLLDLAGRYARRANLDIDALHVDHGLARDSAQWADHCAVIAARLGVACAVHRLYSRPPAGASIEAWAREQRYAALAAVTRHDTLVVTAHHRDDQRETVLQRVLEGAGPHGLVGIRDLRRLGEGHLGRPLLDIERAALHAHAESTGLSWVEDASNQDWRFRRNRLRHEVLPRLEAAVPGARSGLLRLAAIQADVASGLDRFADGLLATSANPPHRIAIDTLGAAGPEWAPFVLRRALARAGCAQPGRRPLEAILGSVCGARRDANPVVRWGGHAVRRYRDELFVTPAALPPVPTAPVTWRAAQPLELTAGTLALRRGRGHALDTTWFDRSRATRDAALTVDFRRGGEVCRPHGSAHRRPLKHLFQEWGVPPWERARTPLLYIDGELAAVVGYCVCERFAARGEGLEPVWTPAGHADPAV